jgi:hypothetical protein
VDTRMLLRLLGVVTDVGLSLRAATSDGDRHAVISRSIHEAWKIIEPEIPPALVQKVLEAERIIVNGEIDKGFALRGLLSELRDVEAPERMVFLVEAIMVMVEKRSD